MNSSVMDCISWDDRTREEEDDGYVNCSQIQDPSEDVSQSDETTSTINDFNIFIYE
jgi:hypothetical protein